MAVLKMAKDSNILENNMVQTQASAAGTLSAIIFIIPGMLMIGYWQDFAFWQTLLVSACGGGIDSPLALVGNDFADTAEFLGLVVFLVTLAIFGRTVLGNKNN